MEQVEKTKDLIIFSNSPGEVSGWVYPIIEKINNNKSILKKYRIFLIIHPCQFGSGNEPYVAESYPGIDFIIAPKEYMKFLILGSWRKKFGLKSEGIMFSLGGNLKHPVWFKKRLRAHYKLYAYTDNPDLPGGEGNFEKIFVRNNYVRDKYLNRGVTPSKIEVVGDLIYNTIKKLKNRTELKKELGILKNEKMFVFLPGSRDFEVLYMLPVFLKVISEILNKFDNIKIFFLKSPFVNYELISRALLMGGKIKEGESLLGTLRKDTAGNAYVINFLKDREIRILDGGLEYWGEGIDFAVTLPGSNTIQLAYRKIPCLVVTPLNKPEVIPFVGILSILKWVPLLGKPILKKAFLAYSKKFKFSALPNIYKNKEIVPELVGIIKTEDITNRLVKIIEDNEIKEIKKRLSQFSLDEDPAEKIVKKVWGI